MYLDSSIMLKDLASHVMPLESTKIVSHSSLLHIRMMHMLQVRLNLQVNSFPNQVNLFQTRSICFNLGQFVSTSVSLFQPRSTCFNPGQFGVGTINTGHRSLFYQYRKYPKHSLKLTLGLIRPKQMFLGLMLALVNG